MPPEIAHEEKEQWLKEFGETVSKVGHGFDDCGVFEGSPFSALVLTNWADHYGKQGEPYPSAIHLLVLPQKEARPLKTGRILNDIEKAVSQYGMVPTYFPEQ